MWKLGILGALLSAALSNTAVGEVAYSGSVSVDARYFSDAPLDARQSDRSGSVSVEPEFYWSWNDGADALTLTAFGRLDTEDSERGHADLREFLWLHVGQDWELRTGIGKVFWGVTESQHLVDIVNQTDLVENPDGEDKLGQPMVWLSLPRDWGIVDLFALPGFRERTFPGPNGRLRTIPEVDADRAQYAHPDGDDHVDWAARWSHYVGPMDFGLSWFRGTSRDPDFVPVKNRRDHWVLAPRYEQVTQWGIDSQAIIGSWLLKLEAIRRTSNAFDAYTAVTAGFEVTFSAFMDTRADLGVLSEYLYSSRGEGAGPFQDDVFAGIRLALNDAQSTEVLAGVIVDRDNQTRLYNLEASRRLGEHWKLGVEARVFSSVDPADPLFSQRDDDYLELSFTYYY